MRVPVADSVTRIISLVDDIVLVSDAQMLELCASPPLPSEFCWNLPVAAGLAAIRAHRFAGDQIATILTGSNIHPDSDREELLGSLSSSKAFNR